VKAVLLAAGVGSRLRPLTDTIPKCMVPVAGKPVIERNIEWLRQHGITNLAVNLHHRPEVVRALLGSGEEFGVRVRYSHEPELMGTAGAVDRLRDWLDDDEFLVIYADNIINCDVGAVVARHRAMSACLTMALYWREDVSASGVARLDAEGRVTAFVEKPREGQTDSHWINAGLLCCSRRVLTYVPRGEFSDFGRDIFPALLSGGEAIAGYRMSPSETLHWIDTPADLTATQAAFVTSAASP
jgi:mannose-1-phosphate guanylyltransferase